jgi:WhiB family redox-sensing transcriptional regulator
MNRNSRPGSALTHPAPGRTWTAAAACAAHPDPDLWFADPTRDEDRHRQAVAICRNCPVRIACLVYALSVPSLEGTWAGLTRNQRARLRNGTPPPIPPRPCNASDAA